jgi:hypothetical protein
MFQRGFCELFVGRVLINVRCVVMRNTVALFVIDCFANLRSKKNIKF